MLAHIIRKEVLDYLMSLRFAIACILCFVVVVCSLFVRHQDYVQTVSAFHEDVAISASAEKQLDHPWRIFWQGLRVYRAPNPLKIFVRGLEDENGSKVDLRLVTTPQFELADVGNPMLPLFPSMDLVTFVGVIMSLLAIVFGYDAVCGEKERGTLRLMLSYGVPRDTVLLGKWVGGCVMLVLPFLLAVLSAAALILVQHKVSLTTAQWGRFAVVCGLSVLYMVTVFSVALWVSCLTRRASTSIMVLVMFWMIFVLAIPNLSPYLAQTWYPGRNQEEVQTALNARVEAQWKADVEEPRAKYDKEQGFGDRWWESIDWSRPETRKRVAERDLFELQVEQRARQTRLRLFAQVEDELGANLDRQVLLSRRIARVSPFACFATAVTELTDTGTHEKRRLMEQVRAFQMKLTEYVYDESIVITRHTIDHDGQEPPPWSQKRQSPIPSFVYVPFSGGEYIRLVIVDTGLLAGMAVLFLLLSYVSFLRYDVR